MCSKFLSLSLLVWLALAPAARSATNQDHESGKQSEPALNSAEIAFDTAREAYAKGEVHKGDAALETMTGDLNSCLASLESAHKSRPYKKAELRVAILQRRMASLLEDINIQDRGWAEQTNRKLEEIHDKLLAGVMRK